VISFWFVLVVGCGTTWELEDRDQDGYTWLDGDCNDNTPLIGPDAIEYCDEVDNDCDGRIDEDDAIDGETWFGDVDGDGFAGDSLFVTACLRPTGYAAMPKDCDDSNAGINPSAIEYCDGVDNDCDEEIDEDDAIDVATWYGDGDGDGFGYDDDQIIACDAPSSYVSTPGDCDDADPDSYPGAAEIPNDGVDSDCDGEDS